MNQFYVRKFGKQYQIALNVDGDPEALYYYNVKRFDDKVVAEKLVDRMQTVNKVNFVYWDFGL